MGLGSPPFPEIYDTALREAAAWKKGILTAFTDHAALATAIAKRYGIEIEESREIPYAQIGRSLAKRRVQFRKVKDRRCIADFLAAIHDQTGLTIIADGLQRNSRVNHPWGLRDKEEYALAEAAQEIAFLFRRHIWIESGTLLVRSRRYAIDKLYEVSDPLVQAWLLKRRDIGGLSFEDHATIAAQFTPEQLETLVDTPVDENSLQVEARTICRYMPLFRLWNSLDEEARRLAQTDGLPLRLLTKPQAKEFWRLCGLATPSAVNGRMAGGGLRIDLSVPLCTVFINTPREEDILRELRIVPLTR